MPDNEQNHNPNPDAQFDGRREGVENAPMGGPTMGVRPDLDSQKGLRQAKNPLHLSTNVNNGMQEFKELMDPDHES